MKKFLSLKAKILITLLCALTVLQGGAFNILAVEPLRISNISVTTTDKTATITWYTNEPADGLIEFERNENFDPYNPTYRFHIASGEPKGTQHTITLYSLIPETKYHFRIISRSDTQEVTSFDQIFETKEWVDNSPPQISRVRAEYVTGTTATIQWETNELADSVIEYGPTISYGSTKSSGSRVIAHDLTITGLEPGNTYHYRVKSKDEKNNTSISWDYTFKTDITQGAEKNELYITELKPISSNDPDITETSAVISYRTNKLADCKVFYGTTTRFEHSISCRAPRNFFHAVTLRDLEPGTRYYYKVESKDVFNDIVIRENLSFVTRGTGPVNPEIFNQLGGASNSAILWGTLSKIGGEQIINLTAHLKPNYPNDSPQLTDTEERQALKFDGKDDYAEIEFQNDFNQLPFSLAIWVKAQNNNNYQAIFSRETTTGHPWNLRLMINQGDGVFYTDIADVNNARLNVTSNISITDNQWHFLVVTLDNYSLKVYVDGNLQAQGDVSNFSIPNTSLQPAWLGASNYKNFSYPFLGFMGPFTFYDRVLTAQKINTLYQNGFTDLVSPQILGESTLDYSQPIALYKTTSSPRIYAIHANGQKHYIPSPSVFEGYGYSWADIRIVSQSTLDRYPEANLVKTPNNPAVYYLYTDKMIRKQIPSPQVFNSYPKNEWANIIVISEQDLAFYPEGLLIKDINESTVYLLEEGVKRPIVSEQAFLNHGFSWGAIAIINKTHLDTFVTGEPIY